jgi:peptidoglycan/xylan/chitin deacetylase (PgdA/CDA1 family)
MSLMEQAPEFLRSVKTPRILSLLYHRISADAHDPQLLCVTPQHFSEHLDVLRRKYRAIKCGDAADGADRVNFSRNSVMVTFDDGYADNLTSGLPALDKYEIPATIFVTTGMVQQQSCFWWDELARIIFGAHSLPTSLEIVLDKKYLWDLSDSSLKFSTQDHLEWNLLCNADPTTRHAVYREIGKFLRGASTRERRKVLDDMAEWAGLPSLGVSDSASLTNQQLSVLAESDLIEIGSHTVSHPVLSKLSIEEQTIELTESKKYLEELLGREVVSFAYPYGTKYDYTAETVALVQECGYMTASSNVAEAIWKGTDRFQLPRLLVRDCDGGHFEKWIAEWFGE